ncbi:hypothetical protein HMPREF1366_02957 [Enterococcus faecium ERV26]|nr:hypothetical protein HMPREF1366_02957 [Enterococcus faecium ERV26]
MEEIKMNEKLLKQILFELKKTNELLQVIASNSEQKKSNMSSYRPVTVEEKFDNWELYEEEYKN